MTKVVKRENLVKTYQFEFCLQCILRSRSTSSHFADGVLVQTPECSLAGRWGLGLGGACVQFWHQPTAWNLPGGEILGWSAPPGATPEPSLGKPGITCWPRCLRQVSGKKPVLVRSDVGEVEKEMEERFKCWDAQPPPSPPSPPQTLLPTAPGCRLSCLPIGCQPPPADQWEGC